MRTQHNPYRTVFLAAFFACCTGVAVSGMADKVLLSVPFLSAGCSLVLAACMVSAVLGALRGKAGFSGIGPALGLGSLAVIAVHLSSSNATYGYPTSPYFPLYYGVILLYASLGAAKVWLAVVAFIVSAELGSLLATGYLALPPSSDLTEFLFRRATRLIGPFSSLALSGLIPYIFVAVRKQDEEPQQPAPADRRPLPRAEAFPARNDTVLIPTSPAPSKTQILLLEQDTGAFAKSGMEELLSSVVYFMSRNFKAYSALGFVFDPQRKMFVLNSFYSRNHSIISGLEIPLGKGIVGRTGVDKNSFMSGDLSLYPEKLLYYGATEAINSVCAVPILSDARELLGALVIDSTDKNSFTEQHKETMRRFSILAAALITNVRMRLYQEKAAKSFQIFYEASQQFITALRTSQVFDVLFKMAGLLTQSTRMMIVTFDDQTRCGVVHKIAGRSPEIGEGLQFSINAGLYSYAFTKRTIVNIGNFPSYRDKYYRFLPNEPCRRRAPIAHHYSPPRRRAADFGSSVAGKRFSKSVRRRNREIPVDAFGQRIGCRYPRAVIPENGAARNHRRPHAA